MSPDGKETRVPGKARKAKGPGADAAPGGETAGAVAGGAAPRAAEAGAGAGAEKRPCSSPSDRASKKAARAGTDGSPASAGAAVGVSPAGHGRGHASPPRDAAISTALASPWLVASSPGVAGGRALLRAAAAAISEAGEAAARRLAPGIRAAPALDRLLVGPLPLCEGASPLVLAAPLRSRSGTSEELAAMARLLLRSAVWPAAADRPAISTIGLPAQQARDRVTALVTHLHPTGDCRTVGVLAPTAAGRTSAAGGTGDAAGTGDGDAAELLAAAAVRAHCSAGGDLLALEVLLTAAADDPDGGGEPSGGGGGGGDRALRRQLQRRLLAAALLELALATTEAARHGGAALRQAQGASPSSEAAGGGAKGLARGAEEASAPPTGESSDEGALLLLHAPRCDVEFWRRQGFCEPRLLPQKRLRAIAVQASCGRGGAGVALECFTPDGTKAPVVLAAVATPQHDYVGTAARAWRLWCGGP